MEITAELETAFTGTAERLAAAATTLEQATINAEATLERIVTSIESSRANERETDLEQRLAAAEAEIAELRASGLTAPVKVTNTVPASQGRKTLPVSMANLLAKQGVTIDSVEAGALDVALNSLSIEQRIAVKAQLMRAGLLS